MPTSNASWVVSVRDSASIDRPYTWFAADDLAIFLIACPFEDHRWSLVVLKIAPYTIDEIRGINGRYVHVCFFLLPFFPIDNFTRKVSTMIYVSNVSFMIKIFLNCFIFVLGGTRNSFIQRVKFSGILILKCHRQS